MSSDLWISHHSSTSTCQHRGKLPGAWVIEEPNSCHCPVDNDSKDEDEDQAYLRWLLGVRWSTFHNLTMTKMSPLPAAILLSLTCEGKAGSLMPVIGFFSRYGALAANWGLGLSSSSVKPMQSHWWARLAFFLFQYSRKVTAEEEQNYWF